MIIFKILILIHSISLMKTSWDNIILKEPFKILDLNLSFKLYYIGLILGILLIVGILLILVKKDIGYRLIFSVYSIFSLYLVMVSIQTLLIKEWFILIFILILLIFSYNILKMSYNRDIN